MKHYIVIKHDSIGNKAINYQRGYHVTLANTEGFRDVPITAIIWTHEVQAWDKQHAIIKAQANRRL